MLSSIHAIVGPVFPAKLNLKIAIGNKYPACSLRYYVLGIIDLSWTAGHRKFCKSVRAANSCLAVIHAVLTWVSICSIVLHLSHVASCHKRRQVPQQKIGEIFTRSLSLIWILAIFENVSCSSSSPLPFCAGKFYHQRSYASMYNVYNPTRKFLA